MKILMVSSFLPYPLTNGGNVRLYNLLKNLDKEFEITLVCEKRDFQTDKDAKEVEKLCKKVITVERKKQWTLANVLKAGFSLNSFLTVGHMNSEMKRKIKEELENNSFNLIHVETFYVMQNLPKTNLPIVLVEHNVEYSVYKRFADRSVFFLQPLLEWDVWKMKRIEEALWRKAKVLVAVSEKEKRVMSAHTVVSNGVDTEKFKVSGSKFGASEKRILFIGDFKWLENRDTARWILKKIWPAVKSKVPRFKIKLWIVGKRIPKKIRSLINDPDVIFDENAPKETPLIYMRAHILLSPIRIGGGTSFKILESMASGVPVVTTTLGAESISKGNEIVVADTTEEVVESVLKLLSDENYYNEVTNNARTLIERDYDWRKITDELETVYISAVKNKQSLNFFK